MAGSGQRVQVPCLEEPFINPRLPNVAHHVVQAPILGVFDVAGFSGRSTRRPMPGSAAPTTLLQPLNILWPISIDGRGLRVSLHVRQRASPDSPEQHSHKVFLPLLIPLQTQITQGGHLLQCSPLGRYPARCSSGAAGAAPQFHCRTSQDLRLAFANC